MSAKNVQWAWYAGAWDAAIADGKQPATLARQVIYAPAAPAAGPNFQPHHQPFNYYANFDPATHPEERAAHLKDYRDLLADIAAGRLPPVAFYKPQGNLNQHPGYASIADGDAHIADLVAKLRAGPQWSDMVIVITYDEYGGAWDHVAPPRGDLLGPGARIPALIVSPYAKKGTVDHTQYDTESILRLIIRRFDLAGLPGIAMRDQALAEHQRAAHGRPDQRAQPRALKRAWRATDYVRRLRRGGHRLMRRRRGTAALRHWPAGAPFALALNTSTSNISTELAGIPGRGLGP